MSTNAVIIGDKKLKLYLKKVQKNLIQKKLLEDIGHFVDLRILERTLTGVGPDDNAFGGYSNKYKLIRQDKGLQTDHVDLFFTGSMFASLTHTVSCDKVTSFFMPTKDRDGVSNPEKAFTNHERYNFFALSNEDVEDIFGIVDKHTDKVIDGRK